MEIERERDVERGAGRLYTDIVWTREAESSSPCERLPQPEPARAARGGSTSSPSTRTSVAGRSRTPACTLAASRSWLTPQISLIPSRIRIPHPDPQRHARDTRDTRTTRARPRAHTSRHADPPGVDTPRGRRPASRGRSARLSASYVLNLIFVLSKSLLRELSMICRELWLRGCGVL